MRRRDAQLRVDGTPAPAFFHGDGKGPFVNASHRMKRAVKEAVYQFLQADVLVNSKLRSLKAAGALTILKSSSGRRRQLRRLRPTGR